MHSDEEPDPASQREKIIGLGELSIRKSYYPELQQKHAELVRKNEDLHAAYEELTATEEVLQENSNALSRKEQELRESQARLLMAQEIGHVGSWEYNLKTPRIWGSAECARIFGFKEGEGEFPLEQIESCIPERERVHQALVDLIGKDKEYNLEFVINPADGTPQKIIMSMARLERDASGNPLRVVGVVQDITKRKQIEEALKENEKFLNNVVENIPDMIFVKDARDLRFVRFNKAGEELIGYAREDLYGKSDYDFFPKDVADFFTRKDRDVLNNKQTLDISEEKIQTRTKGERFLHTKKIPILDETGNPSYLMGISEDITERKRTEEALKLARNKMNLLNAVTFQDIQTAAFTLSAYHELMKTVVMEEKGKEYLEKQLSAHQKILDSLNFAKNYQDMGIKPPQWQNVGQTFLLAISHLDFQRISRNLPVEGLEIYADPLLEMVFFHLMQNVIRHGVGATAITLRYNEKPDRLVLFIEDNGEGIPAAEKHMIFNRGYGKNTGLGLFFVREVLSITGIGIIETGEAGTGTRFEITVPKDGYRITKEQQKK
ncbi:MAG: PAS domain-containing protein [Methanoregula sp.]